MDQTVDVDAVPNKDGQSETSRPGSALVSATGVSPAVPWLTFELQAVCSELFDLCGYTRFCISPKSVRPPARRASANCERSKLPLKIHQRPFRPAGLYTAACHSQNVASQRTIFAALNLCAERTTAQP